ncbi:MAG: DUF5106 domain-containing protein [Rikenellaceae bacterium]|nr:DUF5106 domain-containing protein [Rikenellaceae bacterium]
MRNFTLLLLALIAVGCGGQKSKKIESATPQTVHFKRVMPPVQSTPQAQFQYMVDHYWDRFDFTDTLFIERVDSVEMMRVYAEYIATYVGPYNGEPVARLMKRASVSRKMLDYFATMSEKLFHDPNSPLRSDELYIPVLEAQIAAPFYDQYEKMVPQYDLALASQNRIMKKANDFRYTVASGRTSNLYSLKADFVLIYINNPGCPMCRQIQEQLVASQIVTDALKDGRLKILAIYPDEDLTLWREHPLPKEWINGYDKGRRLEKDRLYDLRAIPAMYLVDREKKVLVKDSTSVPEIERMIVEYQQ